MRSSKRFFWTREPRPPEIARCSGIRRFIPSIVTMESKNAAISWAQPSPEDYLIEKEELAEYEELIRRLYEAISSLPPMQARRVHAYYIAGIKQPEISRREGVHSSKVSVSIRRGLRNMRRCYDDLFQTE